MKEEKDLLKPRYKVIATYPQCRWSVGKILIPDDRGAYEIGDDRWYELEYIDAFPHLFKRLEWWEERTPGELPEYVAWYDPSDMRELLPTVFVVENWYTNLNTSQIAGVYVDGGNRLFINDCKPATLEEYTTYINSQKLKA